MAGIVDYLTADSGWLWVDVDSGCNDIPQLENSFIMRAESLLY